MSLYNRKAALTLASNNKELLIKLNKFSNLTINSPVDAFINQMKISIPDMIEFIKRNEDRKLTLNKFSTTFVNASSSFPIDTNVSQIQTSFQTNMPRDKFYDMITRTITGRNGTMSFTSCDVNLQRVTCEKNNCFTSLQDNYDAIVSMNPRYYKLNEPITFGRMTFFTNIFNFHLLDFYSANYFGRQEFRRQITELILGKDYFTKVINNNIYGKNKRNGFFPDKTIGQEVFYYMLEIYNYDRYNYLIDAYKINGMSTKPGSQCIDDFIGTDSQDYPAFDGVIYYDTSSSMKVEYPGPEILIFSADIKLIIIAFLTAWNNKLYLQSEVTEMKEDFLNFINSGAQAPNTSVLLPCTSIKSKISDINDVINEIKNKCELILLNN